MNKPVSRNKTVDMAEAWRIALEEEIDREGKRQQKIDNALWVFGIVMMLTTFGIVFSIRP